MKSNSAILSGLLANRRLVLLLSSVAAHSVAAAQNRDQCNIASKAVTNDPGMCSESATLPPTIMETWTVCGIQYSPVHVTMRGACCDVLGMKSCDPSATIAAWSHNNDVCTWVRKWRNARCSLFPICDLQAEEAIFKSGPCLPCLGGTDPSPPGEDDEQPQIPGDNNCGPQEIGCGSPILVSERGNRLELTNLDGGVRFDLDSDGFAKRVSWTSAGSDDAFLALDRNGNGIIDTGVELFGNFTPQDPSPNPNGFIALSAFDDNGDGWITEADSIFPDLLFWTDANHDGVSQGSELEPVAETWITGFCLRYRESRRVDRYGNLFRYISVASWDRTLRAARRKLAVDVFFLRDATHE